MTYTIKQVSEQTHLSTHALRFYEKEGLLSQVNRGRGGIRYYNEEDMKWLALICCLKNTGMALKEIKIFVDLSEKGDETLKERCALLKAHKAKVEVRISEMQTHLETVTRKIGRYTKQYQQYLYEKQKHSD